VGAPPGLAVERVGEVLEVVSGEGLRDPLVEGAGPIRRGPVAAPPGRERVPQVVGDVPAAQDEHALVA
jgi:hypothetical protein